MPWILARYFSKSLLKHFLLFTCIALILAAMIQFMENRDGLLDEPNLGLADVVWFSLLNAPAMFSLLAGFIALVSAMLAGAALLKSSELKVMLTTGLSAGQFIGALLPAAIAIGGLHFLVENIVMPRAAAELRDWGIGRSSYSPLNGPQAIWVDQGDSILMVGHLLDDGRSLADVQLFMRDGSGDVTEHIAGPSAYFEAGSLVFPEASRTVFAGSATTIEHDYRVATVLDFETLAALSLHPRNAPVWQIARVLNQSQASSYARHVYAFWFHRKLAAPVTTVLIILLLGPLMPAVQRIGRIIPLLALGLAVGFLCLVADGVLVGMGDAGLLSPAAAAWGLGGVLALLLFGLASLQQASGWRR